MSTERGMKCLMHGPGRKEASAMKNLRMKAARVGCDLSQEELAAKAEISRTYLSHIEAPGMAYGFSLEVFFNIADALDVDPAALINASMFPDELIRKK